MSWLSRGTLAQPETWGKVPVVVFYGLFFYSVQKLGSFVVLVLFFSTLSLQNMKYPTLMHWLASWVNSTSKTIFHSSSTTSQVPPVQFSLDSVALNFGPIWGHRPSLKHCVTRRLDLTTDPRASPSLLLAVGRSSSAMRIMAMGRERAIAHAPANQSSHIQGCTKRWTPGW